MKELTVEQADNRKYYYKKIRGNILINIFFALIYLIGIFFFVVCFWSKRRFNVHFNDIIITLTSSTEGADDNVVVEALIFCVPLIILGMGIIAALYIIIMARRNKILASDNVQDNIPSLKRLVLLRRLIWLGSPVILLLTILYVNNSYDIRGYIESRLSDSSIYEKHYVSPESVDITLDGKKKNLLYIYMESMEDTYASVEAGGSQSINYIPNLTEMAEENVSFAPTEKLGGFYANYGATWTFGALYTSMSGVPYNLPLEGNTPPDNGEFASGLITIGEVLEDKGYHNEFLCGSDADFAGRRLFLTKHGNYEIYDYYTAIEKGVIGKKYKHWWGYEDKILYDIAKDELTRLYENGQPFNLTMLTADTHFPDGYVCDLCRDDYPEKAANVVACADRQIKEFIDWCREQPFFKDTVIVITGDHRRMDNALVEGVDVINRSIYNCIINGIEVDDSVMKGRQFETIDIFPTVIAAMGYEIEGNRLGLGTNLYYGNKTLMEQYEINGLEQEFIKSSDFYLDEFAPELK